MANAMTNQGQGSTAHFAFPAWAPNTDPSIGTTSFIELEFELHAFGANGFAYLVGHSLATQGLSITPNFEPRFMLGTVERIKGPVGTAALNRRDVIRFEYDDTGSSTTAWMRLYYNSVLMGAYQGSIAQSANALSYIARSATQYCQMTVYRLEMGVVGGASYDDGWDETTATGSGTTWASKGGTRALTATNFTGAADSWWVFYSDYYVGEGTITVSAAASAALAGSKIGHAAVSAIAASSAAIQGCKIGASALSMPLSAGILLTANKVANASYSVPVNAVLGVSAHKVGISPIHVEAAAEINLYAGNLYIGEGTFSVSASASITMQGEKVGQSQVQFEAAAATYCSGAKLGVSKVTAITSAEALLHASKTSQSAPRLEATGEVFVDGYKIGLGSVVTLASVTISLSGSNPAAEPAPVTLVFVRTSSRHTHNMRTTSRYNYNIKTSSGGARV